METPSAHLVGAPRAAIAPHLPEDVCDLIIDIIMNSLLNSRKRRAFVFTALEDFELHREELNCRATLAAGACVSRAWHYPFQYRLSQHIWLSSDAQYVRLASRAYTASPSLVQEITLDPSGQALCNPSPCSCHCVIGHFGQFPSVEKLSLCGVAWRAHPQCMRPRFSAMHQHITRLALVWVHFQSVTHLRRLLESLPELRALECSHLLSDENEESLPSMARCAKLRELRILDVDKRISAFFGNVEDGAKIPPVEVLSVALYVDYLERNTVGWRRYQEVLDTYSESVRELRLMLNVQDEGFRPSMSLLVAILYHGPLIICLSPPALMLPDGLAKYKNLQKIMMVLRVTPAPRLYSCFSSLLSRISSSKLSEISLSFRPVSSYRDDISSTKLAELLDICPVLSAVDNTLARNQFMSIRRRGIRIELATAASKLSTILDDALQQGGGWEVTVRQCMPRSDAAGLLRCVR